MPLNHNTNTIVPKRLLKPLALPVIPLVKESGSKSVKFLLVKSEILLGIGIRNPTKDWNLESNFLWNQVPGICNPRRGICNPRRGICNPRRGICNPWRGIRNPRRGIQNPRLSWSSLHGAKHKFFDLVSKVVGLTAHVPRATSEVTTIGYTIGR